LENAPAAGSATGTLANGGLCAPSASYPRGAVVLCKRGTYSLADKVRSVQKGGGKAAVIYNNVPGLFGGTLGDDPGVTISAIALSQEDGQRALGYAGKQATAVSLYDPAPGSGYEAWDGTSMATPHVSGVAALVWSRKPAATNRQIRDALDASATDLGTAGRDTSYGWGLVQAKRALDVLNGTVTPRCRLVKQSCSSSSRCCSGTCSSGVCK
jgi:hypothetical protein